MKLSMKQIINLLPDIPVQLFSQDKISKKYSCVKPVVNYQTQQIETHDNIIYIGFTSEILLLSNITQGSGFILVDDGKYDLEDITSNVFHDILIINGNINMLGLYDRIQKLFLIDKDMSNLSIIALNALTQRQGLKGFTDICYSILENPVIICKCSTGQLITYSADGEIHDPLLLQLIDCDYNSDDYYRQFDELDIQRQLYENPYPILVDKGFAQNHRRLIGLIKMDEDSKNDIAIIVLEADHTFKDDDLYILSVICDALTERLQKHSYVYSLNGFMHECYINDLIDKKYTALSTSPAINSWLRSVGWKQYDNYYLAVCTFEGDVNIAFNIRGKLERNIANCLTTNYREQIIILINCSFNNIFDKIKEEIADTIKKYKCICGISLLFKDLEKISIAYGQASQAIDIGAKLSNEYTVYDYNNYQLYDLLYQCSNYVDISNYCHMGLKILTDYDEENGTDYYNTLYIYLQSGCNKAKAAKELYIHRNTMTYRIQVITELLSLNFDNIESITHLHLSYIFRECIKKWEKL